MSTAWIEISTEAYRSNLAALARHTGRSILAVVKADAYGHGAEVLARVALECGCVGIAVARVAEGAALRAAGVPGRILQLGLTLPEQADEIVALGLEPVVAEPAVVAALAAAAAGEPVPVHVEVDTGLTRAGLPSAEAVSFCHRIRSDPRLRLAGVMTHFASAESEEPTAVAAPWERFLPVYQALRSLPDPPVFHAANSAAALWFPPARLDWVRGGLVTYGVPPADRPVPFPLVPVAGLVARVVQVRTVPAGSAVSYGGTWTAPRPARLALAPVGYGDGLPWALGNQGYALVRGHRAPFRGRVCMDQVVLDVTEIPGVSLGDEAVFLGRQGTEQIRVEELAALAGTIPYEILTRLGNRLPRRVV